MPSSRNPQMQAILERLRAAPAVDYRTLPLGDARAIFEDSARPWQVGAPEIETVRDLWVPRSAGEMRSRLYRPQASGPLPLILYVHGGGWTFGSVETHDGTMRNLAAFSGCAVLGIDYRLAPEHAFPEPLDDVLDAVAFVARGGIGEGVDGTRIALSGDSAGANLALAALVATRDRALPPLAGAALYYGCYAPEFETGSHARLGDGSFGLSTEIMRWYWGNFLGSDRNDTKSLAAPVRRDLSGLPPLYIEAAGLDPLRDDTFVLAERLAAAGVPFRFDFTPEVVHGFLRMSAELDAARETLAAGAAFLAALLKR